MKLKPVTVLVLLSACTLAACSNVLTYIRHDETKDNVQCGGETGVKRDTACNATVNKVSPNL
jgi:hypothetical protein